MQTFTDISKIKMFFMPYSKATIRTFIELVTVIIQARTTSLYKCKDKMKQVSGKKKTQADSHYKRLLRFFCLPGMEEFCNCLFLFLLHLTTGCNPNILVMDRSNWKRGKKNINILTLGILWNHCFIPLSWKQLDKRGNSNFSERIALFKRFIQLWEKAGKSIKNMTLVADREFIGPEWLNYLHGEGLFFVIRLRENMRLGEIEARNKKNRQLRSYAREIERYGIYQLPVYIGENQYWLVMTKNFRQNHKEPPYIFFITNISDARIALQSYAQRWKVECCFKHLKKNGFNIEAMNFKDNQKIELLMGIVVTAYVIAIREGILEQLRKPFPMKKYAGGKKYAAISVFRKGLEIIDGILENALALVSYLLAVFRSRNHPVLAVFHSRNHPAVLIQKIKNVQ